MVSRIKQFVAGQAVKRIIANLPYFSKENLISRNLLTPCMIIDNPHILREAVATCHVHPTHESADQILKGEIAKFLDEYAKKIKCLTEEEWQSLKTEGSTLITK